MRLFFSYQIKIIFFVLLLFSCGPRSPDDFREQGAAIVRSLTQELKSIHSRDELLARSDALENLFSRLVDLMIAARQYQLKHPRETFSEIDKKQLFMNDQLRLELTRIYRLDQGRELIEKLQEEPLHRLDAFEYSIKKRPIKP